MKLSTRKELLSEAGTKLKEIRNSITEAPAQIFRIYDNVNQEVIGFVTANDKAEAQQKFLKAFPDWKNQMYDIIIKVSDKSKQMKHIQSLQDRIKELQTQIKNANMK
jgi:hypothetical protein